MIPWPLRMLQTKLKIIKIKHWPQILKTLHLYIQAKKSRTRLVRWRPPKVTKQWYDHWRSLPFGTHGSVGGNPWSDATDIRNFMDPIFDDPQATDNWYSAAIYDNVMRGFARTHCPASKKK
eukprot:392172_1